MSISEVPSSPFIFVTVKCNTRSVWNTAQYVVKLYIRSPVSIPNPLKPNLCRKVIAGALCIFSETSIVALISQTEEKK